MGVVEPPHRVWKGGSVDNMPIDTALIYKHKESLDPGLAASFSHTVEEMLFKFKSLSKTVAYKKVQRANIINVQRDDDSILNLLNKISPQNFERIESKILLKCTRRNTMQFVEQVLHYVDKTDALSVPLCYDVIKSMYQQSEGGVRREIADVFNGFSLDFVRRVDRGLHVEEGDHGDMTKEAYIEFVQRNANNCAAINRMHLMRVALSDTSSNIPIRTTLRYMYRSLLNGLREAISRCEPDKAPENNNAHLIMEFLLIFIHSKKWMRSEEHAALVTEFDTDAVKKKLTNKNRFKLLDILDIARKESSPQIRQQHTNTKKHSPCALTRDTRQHGESIPPSRAFPAGARCCRPPRADRPESDRARQEARAHL